MNSSSLRVLEFDKVRDMLVARVSSARGKELAGQLTPVNDFAEVERRLLETQEARDILASGSHVPLGGVYDLRRILRRAQIGAVLEPEDLSAIGNTLYVARRMKQFFAELKSETGFLREYADQIIVLRNIESTIENAIDEQGRVRDSASSELARLRREIRLNQARVKEKLENILRSEAYQKFLQDNIVTVRGDRYVVPVKQEYRNNFPGIIHDQSASGATVFIEPMAVVNLNNTIKQLMAAEVNEIERILRVITGQIAQVVSQIALNCDMLARLDLAFAKGKLALDMAAHMPRLNHAGKIKLIRARHPLIETDKVVPIDIWLGDTFTTLLITGPNTGGKTVTLKTVGLFALMAQAGLLIPADPGSEMPVFYNVFADIGDEQSIEQNLSTFSAHMTNIVRIIRNAGPKDLVLLDEVGAGTDPNEGAALAMAILEYLHELGCRTIATTHYSELKRFAYSRPGIENASVEFDIATLKPTYRLQIGIPGSSNAFAISRRLGLASDIIQRAKQFINKDETNFEEILAALETQKKEYMRRSEELAALERRLAAERAELEKEREQLAARRQQAILKAKQEAAAIVRQARREAEEVIAQLKAQFQEADSQVRQQAVQSARAKLRQAQLEAVVNEQEPQGQPVERDKVKVGDQVFVNTLKQKGTVVEVGVEQLTVQLGFMKVNVPFAACQLLSSARLDAAGETSRQPSLLSKAQHVSREIDLRGLTIDEAISQLDKYIDDALLAGLNEVFVIHGKGTGALRQGVQSYLREHPRVAGIRIGELNEGGSGVTVVKLV